MRLRSHPREYSLATHLLLTMLAVAIPIAAFSVYVLLQMFEAGRDESMARLAGTTHGIGQAIDAEIESAQKILLYLARSPSLRNGDFAAFDAEANQALDVSIDAVVLVDSSGQQLVSTRRPFGTALPKTEALPILRPLFETGVPISSDLTTGTIDRNQVLFLSVPVYGNDGHIVYALSASLSSSWIANTLQPRLRQAELIAALLDRTGTRISSNREQEKFLGGKASPDMVAAMTKNDEGTVTTSTVDGVPVYVHYARSALTGWTLAVAMPTAVVTKPFLKEAMLLGLGQLSFLLLAGLLAWRMARRIAEPVHELRDAALALGRGERREMPRTGIAEISEIGTALGQTAELLAAREEHQRAANRLRHLFSQAPGLIAVLRGPNHVFELANDAFVVFVGRRDLLGRPMREALPELAGQGYLEWLDRVYETRQPFTGRDMAMLLRRGDDSEIETLFLDLLYQPIIEIDGSISGIFVQAIDTTQRHRATSELTQVEEERQLAVDAAGLGSWLYEPLTGKLVWDARCKQLFGLLPDSDVTFDSFLARVHPEDRQHIQHILRDAADPLGPGLVEAEYRTIDATGFIERWIATRGRSFFDSDHKTCLRVVGVVMDITDRKRAEAELRQLNEALEERVSTEVNERLKAEESLRQVQKIEAVGQLTGGVAHDFNNLLTSVLGNLELIEMRTAEENIRKLAQAGSRAANRGAKLTQQLLAFSRKQHLSALPVDLNGAVVGIIEVMRRTLGGSVEIETRLGASLWSALVDPTQIELAILNLSINARDAMPQGGTLTIATRNCKAVDRDKPAGLAPGDYVVVTVSDTGEGMPPDIVARAIEPFFTTKKVGQGTGLGLSQVYGLARQSGGDVRIVSAVGEGTVIDIFLPRALRLSGDAPEEKASAPAGQHRGSILVVDDQEEVRELVVAQLEELGYETLQAPGGARALELIERGVHIDLLLIDFAMAGMTGIETVKAARVIRPALPVIVMTGYADFAALELEEGSVALLKKPFRLHELASAIDGVRSKEPPPPSAKIRPLKA